MVDTTEQMEVVLDKARDLGKSVRKQMDPLCDEHLRELEHHPISDEFSNTRRHSQFKDLVHEYMREDERVDAESPRPESKTECRREVRQAFDDGFYQKTDDKVTCIACRQDKPIRVNDPEALNPENILLGKVRSGKVGREDEYDEEARWQ